MVPCCLSAPPLAWRWAPRCTGPSWTRRRLPRLVFVNKMDRDNASFTRTLEQLRTKFDKTFVPVQLPIGAQDSFAGVIDLVDHEGLPGR